MTEYICKCGRKVSKSTKADNTGNRETVGCDGCPYLMPWGPTRWDDTRRSFVHDVQGYECRMSPRLEYTTEIIGRVDDKCTMHIDSLDFDFLDRVQAWIKEHYPAGEISGDFNPDFMRACQYVSDGRYRMSISCAQNKAGMAAKVELMRAFFDRESKRRLDKTPEEEKQKVLDDIDRGKELGKGPDAEAIADQDYEEAHKPVIYEDGKSLTLYRVPVKATADGVYPIQRMLYHTCVYEDVPDYTATASRDSALAALEERARAGGWTYIDIEAKLYGKTDEEAEAAVLSEDIGLTGPTGAAEEAAVTEPTETAAPASGDDVCNHCVCRECDDERCLQAHCDCRDKGMGCWKPDDDCKHDHPELFSDAVKSRLLEHGVKTCTLCANYTALKAPTKNADGATSTYGYCVKNGGKYPVYVPGASCKDYASAAPAAEQPEAPAEEKTEITTKTAAIAAPETAPAAFDYSGLDEPTAEIMHNADRIMQTARRNYIFDTARGVKMAHDALSSHYGGTFGKWCESYGMSRVTANKLLQVVNLIYNSTSEEQAVLEQAPATLLYAAAKPSAPAEAVEAVKAGDVTTMPEYKALLDQLARKDEAIRAAQEAAERNARIAKDAQELADTKAQRAENAERRAREAEKERDGARQVVEAAKMHAEKWKAEAEAARRAPIVPATVVDQDEVERRAQELATKIINEQQSDSDAAHNAYDAVILACRTWDTAWQMAKAQTGHIPQDMRAPAREMILKKLIDIKEDVNRCL